MPDTDVDPARGAEPREAPLVHIEAVLFDLGGTLVDTRDFAGWSADAKTLGVNAEPERLAVAWETLRPWSAKGDTNPQNRWKELLSHAAGIDVPEATVLRFLTLRSERPLYGALYSDVRRCIDRLRRAGKRLGIISNSRSESSVRELLGRMGIQTEFELVVSSGSEGVQKPASEIFRIATDRLRIAPDACLFVGDDIENDVLGSARAGLHSVWLNRLGEGIDSDVPEILSLSEVPRIVRLLEAGAPVK